MKDVLPITERLRELLDQLPHDIQADWDGTNHYELQTPRNPDHEWWWLVVSEGVGRSDTEEGRRLGLVLDIIAELSRCLTEEEAR